MSGPEAREAAAALLAAYDRLAACEVDLLTAPELIDVLDGLQTLSCQLPTQFHRLLARVQVETTHEEMGAKS